MNQRMIDFYAHDLADSRRNVILVGRGALLTARRVIDFRPRLTDGQRRWLIIDHKVVDFYANGFSNHIPFRAPHHTVSRAALCGTADRIGEVRLARFGVLFLDELISFDPRALDGLNYELARMGATAPQVIASAAPFDRPSDRNGLEKLARILGLEVEVLP